MEKVYPRVDLVHNRVLRLLLLFILFIPNLSLSQTNLLLTRDLNSFETPIVTDPLGYEYTPSGSAWTFTGESGLTKTGPSNAFTWANPNAPAQNQVLFLQNQGYVETIFNFPSNGYYRFLFKAAWREGCCEQPKYIRVLVDGVEAGEVELRSKNYEEYFTLPLELTSGNHTIRLEGDNPTVWGDYTGFVDDFRIQSLPVLVNYPYMTVQPGTTYVIGSSNYNFTLLKVRGTLVAPQNHDVNITSNYILVEDNGRFQIGQELSPYQEEATITLNGSNPNQLGGMGTKFLGAMDNGVIELHGQERVSWTKLSKDADSGGRTIEVVDPVDWEAGDQIVIAPSGLDHEEYEERTISSVTNNKKFTVGADLSYDHIGETKPYSGNSQSWSLDMRAEVGLLSRNIKIQGSPVSFNENDQTYKLGAHVMIMGNAEAYFDGVELYRVGQARKKARYPFHWHVRGNAIGQYFKNSSVHESYNRALTIHATNDVLVENNVFFDHLGHGIFFEDGNEQRNRVIGNLVMGTKRPVGDDALTKGETIDEIQNRGPASFWITHPNNTIEDNVAAGTVGTGYWYIFPIKDITYGVVDPQTAPFGSFRNNVAHSCESGFDVFDELINSTGHKLYNNAVFGGLHGVFANIGYYHPSGIDIVDCTWYSNGVAVYSGTGSNDRYWPKNEFARENFGTIENLNFINNLFADNEISVMFASNATVKNSLFVANADLGNTLVTGPGTAGVKSEQTLVHVYDGAGTIRDSHIVGYNSNASSMMSTAGASITYGNFKFENTTKANSLVVNVPGGDTNGRGRRNATIYDKDGSLSGSPGTLVMNNPFNLLGDITTETNIPGWTNVIKSTNGYVNTRLFVYLYDAFCCNRGYGWFPDVKVTRTKTGTTEENISYNFYEPILPFIVNDPDLLYTYEFTDGIGTFDSELPSDLIGFQLTKSAEPDDYVIVRFKNMNTLPGVLTVEMNSDPQFISGQANQQILPTTSLSTLKSSQHSVYYISGDDLYIKAIANGYSMQYFSIKWGVSGGDVANNTERLGGEQSLTEATEMIYPNPASNKLYIKGLSEGGEVQIVDISGKIMQTTTYKEYLDISKLKSGVYVVRTKQGNHRFIKE